MIGVIPLWSDYLLKHNLLGLPNFICRKKWESSFNDGGVIDEKERAMLSCMQNRMGISEERAKEIENEVISGGDLSTAEKEYLELYKEFLEYDGIIDDKGRRLLQREQS